MKKRLALIGCGGIGEYHLSHFVQFKDIVDLEQKKGLYQIATGLLITKTKL